MSLAQTTGTPVESPEALVLDLRRPPTIEGVAAPELSIDEIATQFCTEASEHARLASQARVNGNTAAEEAAHSDAWQAFSKVIELTHDEVTQNAKGMQLQTGEPADFVQAGFEHAFQRVETYRGGSAISWVWTITKRLALTEKRTERRGPAYAAPDDLEKMNKDHVQRSEYDDPAELVSGGTELVLGGVALEGLEQIQRDYEAAEVRLTDYQRRALKLARLGHRPRHIGEILGMDANAASALLLRGRRTLEEEMRLRMLVREQLSRDPDKPLHAHVLDDLRDTWRHLGLPPEKLSPRLRSRETIRAMILKEAGDVVPRLRPPRHRLFTRQ